MKRPGQTLGLYIREGNGLDRSDGVFISRIALESAVYNSGCLKVGDEILAVNMVDVTRMSLDDVVIIMSIPRRLVLVTRQRKAGRVPIKCLSYEEICCLCCASLFSVLDCGIFVCSLACMEEECSFSLDLHICINRMNFSMFFALIPSGSK